MDSITCFKCGKTPEEIVEYAAGFAWEEGDFASPTAYVKAEEGTYNSQTGHFACTECYMAVGMPGGSSRWVAP